MTTRIGIAIAEPRYEPNTLARSLRVGHSQTLGVLFNPVHNVFYGNAMRTIQIEARRGGFTVMLLKHQENAQLQQGRLASLKQSQIDGVILEPAAETKGARVRAILGLTPVVTLDRPLGSGVDSVILDNQMAGLGATDRLLWYQHRHILSITPPYKLYPLHSRLKGHTEAIAAVGRRVKTIIWRDAEHLTRELSPALQRNRAPATAALSMSYSVTIAILSALRDCSIPLRHIGFTWIDNQECARFLNPSLTAVAQPAEQFTKVAVDQLFQRIAEAKHGPVHVTLPGKLIVRASCACDLALAHGRGNVARLIGLRILVCLRTLLELLPSAVTKQSDARIANLHTALCE